MKILTIFIVLAMLGSCIPDITPTPLPTETLDPTLDIRGWLTFEDGVPYIILSLCEIKYNDEGFRFCAYDPHEMWEKGLRVYPEEETGYFEFHNVPPGEWALVMDIISQAIIPNYPDTNDPVIFIVNSEIVELMLHYSEPYPFHSDPPSDPPYPPPPPSTPPYPNP